MALKIWTIRVSDISFEIGGLRPLNHAQEDFTPERVLEGVSGGINRVDAQHIRPDLPGRYAEAGTVKFR